MVSIGGNNCTPHGGIKVVYLSVTLLKCEIGSSMANLTLTSAVVGTRSKKLHFHKFGEYTYPTWAYLLSERY